MIRGFRVALDVSSWLRIGNGGRGNVEEKCERNSCNNVVVVILFSIFFSASFHFLVRAYLEKVFN